MKSSLRCLICKNFSHKFESFMYLSIPIIESTKEINLYDCIENFMIEEELEKQERWLFLF